MGIAGPSILLSLADLWALDWEEGCGRTRRLQGGEVGDGVPQWELENQTLRAPEGKEAEAVF